MPLQVLIAAGLELLFLIQPMVSGKLALAFNCTKYGSSSFLDVDLRIDCASSEYKCVCHSCNDAGPVPWSSPVSVTCPLPME